MRQDILLLLASVQALGASSRGVIGLILGGLLQVAHLNRQ
jgi:hypothetical protein